MTLGYPKSMDPSCASLNSLVAEVRACRICRDAPRYRPPLPHEPRPVFQVSATARLCIAGQAPGVRAHASGRPFTDPSGARLREWLGIGEEIFYDPQKVAIVGMGFCFPGLAPKAATCLRAASAGKLGTHVSLSVCQISSSFCLSANTPKSGVSARQRCKRIDRNGHEMARCLSFRPRSARDADASSLLAEQRLAEAQSVV